MPRVLTIPDRLVIDCTSTLTKHERDLKKKIRVEFDMTGAGNDLDSTTFGKGLMLWAGDYIRKLKEHNRPMWEKVHGELKVSIPYKACGTRTTAPKVDAKDQLVAELLASGGSVEDLAKELQAKLDKINAAKEAAAETELEEAREEVEESNE